MKCEVMSGQIPGQPDASDQPYKWLGLRVLLWTLVSMIAVLSGGCATKPLSLKDWYSPPQVTALPHLKGVAIYQFTDKRDSPYDEVGQVTGTKIKVSKPVTVSVTRAFAEGLKARGFPVVELTGSDASPESRPDVLVAVSGEIQEFWVALGYGRYSTNQRMNAGCIVLLQVYEMATGQKLWEKAYSGQYRWSASQPGRDRLDMGPALAKVLALTVEEAVYDPEFVRELRRR